MRTSPIYPAISKFSLLWFSVHLVVATSDWFPEFWPSRFWQFCLISWCFCEGMGSARCYCVCCVTDSTSGFLLGPSCHVMWYALSFEYSYHVMWYALSFEYSYHVMWYALSFEYSGGILIYGRVSCVLFLSSLNYPHIFLKYRNSGSSLYYVRSPH